MGAAKSSSAANDPLSCSPVIARRLQAQDNALQSSTVHHPLWHSPVLARGFQAQDNALQTSSVHDPLWRSPVLARRLQEQENKNAMARQQEPKAACSSGERQAPVLLGKKKPAWCTNTSGEGKRLGGGEAAAVEDRVDAKKLRLRSLDAAERWPKEAPGISEEPTALMQERQVKGVLLGKLQEHCLRWKLEMPMRVNAASVEQLKKYWDKVKAGADIRALH